MSGDPLQFLLIHTSTLLVLSERASGWNCSSDVEKFHVTSEHTRAMILKIMKTLSLL